MFKLIDRVPFFIYQLFVHGHPVTILVTTLTTTDILHGNLAYSELRLPSKLHLQKINLKWLVEVTPGITYKGRRPRLPTPRSQAMHRCVYFYSKILIYYLVCSFH